MVRKLKFHEQKLLKKVDFISWKESTTIEEAKTLRRYHIQKPDDLTKYNQLARFVREIVRKIKELDNPAFQIESMDQLGEKLYKMGLINDKKILETVSGTSFCRRRLPVRMVKTKMARNVADATKYVQQGHVRVGPEVIKDPAYLVTRSMDDFITWVDTSAIKRHILEYNEMRDDYEM